MCSSHDECDFAGPGCEAEEEANCPLAEKPQKAKSNNPETKVEKQPE